MLTNIVHQIILSNSPEEIKKCKEWEENHNKLGWSYKLWTEKDLEDISHPLLKKAENVEERKLISAYLIIKQFGGWHIDSRTKFLKHLDTISDINARAFLVPKQGWRFTPYVFAAELHHSLLDDIIDSLERSLDKYKTLTDRCGINFFHKIAMFYVTKKELPQDYFFPFLGKVTENAIGTLDIDRILS